MAIVLSHIGFRECVLATRSRYSDSCRCHRGNGGLMWRLVPPTCSPSIDLLERNNPFHQEVKHRGFFCRVHQLWFFSAREASPYYYPFSVPAVLDEEFPCIIRIPFPISFHLYCFEFCIWQGIYHRLRDFLPSHLFFLRLRERQTSW